MTTQTKLSKSLKPHWVVAIAFGSAIGWGAFVLPTDWMRDAGPIGVILGVIIGAALIMIIAVSYDYMVRRYPVSGGEFVYSYLSFGRFNAYICGWFVTLSYVTSVALNATALIVLFKFLYPDLVEIGYMYSIAGWDVYFSQIVLVGIALSVFGYMNIRGVGLSGRAQFWFSVILVVGAALMGLAATLAPSTTFSNLTPAFNTDIGGWQSILSILALAPFLYSGFNNIAQASEEFEFSTSKVLLLMFAALSVGAFVYAIMVYATAMGGPWQELANSKPTWGTADVMSNLFGSVGLFILVAALCMGIFTGMNGFLVSSSRMLLAMSRAQILPDALGKIHSTHRTPYAGIIVAALVCFIAPWFGRQVLMWLVNMTATGVAIAYFYTCASAYKMMERDASWFQRSCAVFGAVVSAIFLLLLFVPESPAFLPLPSLVALITWTLLGGLFYVLNQKKFNAIPDHELRKYILGYEESANSNSDGSYEARYQGRPEQRHAV